MSTPTRVILFSWQRCILGQRWAHLNSNASTDRFCDYALPPSGMLTTVFSNRLLPYSSLEYRGDASVSRRLLGPWGDAVRTTRQRNTRGLGPCWPWSAQARPGVLTCIRMFHERQRSVLFRLLFVTLVNLMFLFYAAECQPNWYN